MPRRPAATAALALALAAAAAAPGEEGPEPLAAWRRGQAGVRADARPEPVALEVESVAAFERRLGELAEGLRWGDVLAALEARLEGEVHRGSAFAVPGAPALLGARLDARRRLRALPSDLLAPARSDHDAEVDRLLQDLPAPPGRREEVLADLLTRYPACPGADEAARLLGELYLERGEVARAELLWREHGGAEPALARRLLALRGRPDRGLDGPRRAGARAPELALLWVRPTPGRVGGVPCARPGRVGPDAALVVDATGRLVALERATGRLRWRSLASGAVGPAGIALGHGLVAQAARDGLSALDPATGELRWRVGADALAAGEPLGERDGVEAVVATPTGFALLATFGEVRHVVGVDPAGAVAWRTELWGDRLADHAVWLGPERAAAPPDDAIRGDRPHVVVRPTALAKRAVWGDGRLATVGDALFLTADGLVARLDGRDGALLWLRDRTTGPAVAGPGQALVSLRADAYAVEAATAAGHLARLDPLDGRSLPAPRDPALRAGDPAPDRAGHVVCADPLVLAWGGADDDALVLRLGAAPARDLARLAPHRIAWPGAAAGGTLALPGRDGVTLLDLASGDLAGALPWPPSGPGRLVWERGLLLVVGPRSVAAYGPAGLAPPPDPVDPTAPVGELIADLGASDWRARAAARAALVERRREALEGLQAARRRPASAEAAVAIEEILAAVERRTRWERLAPGAPAELIERVVARPSRTTVREVLRHLDEDAPHADADLRAELAASRFPEPLVVALLRRDPRLQGALVSLARNEPDVAARRAATTLAVAAGADDGPLRPLQVLLRTEARLLAVEGLLLHGDDALRERLVPDEAFWEERRAELDQVWLAQGGPPRPDPEARAAVVEALRAAAVD